MPFEIKDKPECFLFNQLNIHISQFWTKKSLLGYQGDPQNKKEEIITWIIYWVFIIKLSQLFGVVMFVFFESQTNYHECMYYK